MAQLKQSIGSKKSLWDVLVVRPDGEWVGFRTPIQSLRALGNYFAFILIVCLMSLGGLLVARWKIVSMSQVLNRQALELSALKQKSEALPFQTRDHKSSEQGSVEEANIASFDKVYLPRMVGGVDLGSQLLEIDQKKLSYDRAKKRISLEFRIQRKPPHTGLGQYRWVLLMSAKSALKLLPESLDLSGDFMVDMESAGQIKEFKKERRVDATFNVQNFIEELGIFPLNSVLMLFDEKGDLLVYQSMDLKRESI